MPILVYICHLYQDFLYVLVSGFHYTTHLRAIGNRISMLDLEMLVELLDHFPIYVHPIICNELSRHAIAANNVMFQESGYHCLSDAFVQSGFHSLCKIING